MTNNPLLLPMCAEVSDYPGLTINIASRCFTRLRKLDVIGLPARPRADPADRAAQDIVESSLSCADRSPGP